MRKITPILWGVMALACTQGALGSFGGKAGQEREDRVRSRSVFEEGDSAEARPAKERRLLEVSKPDALTSTTTFQDLASLGREPSPVMWEGPRGAFPPTPNHVDLAEEREEFCQQQTLRNIVLMRDLS